ncbi:MAG TPA: ABC transporter ATP-binding protein [Oscillospiraceae bacterium]|nr:ABC transporter ATP-binding protein [Oscillospiraceae bacterium]
MLRAENITLAYNDHRIINNLSLVINKGDLMTIIGINGSGKSTILKALARNLKPTSGTIYLENQSLFSLNTRAVARKIAMLPQMPQVPDDFTTRDLVSYGRYPYLGWNSRLKSEDQEVVDWAIAETRITDLQHRRVSTLSGGERQRVWFAMTLAQEPEILLLDEPTTFLDICYQFEILELVKKLNSSLSLTIVMILHDLNQAARYSNRIAVLKDGGIYHDGAPADVISEQMLRDVFKIEAKVIADREHNCPFFLPLSSSRKQRQII